MSGCIHSELPVPVFMQIPASELLLFFPSQKGKFWPDLEKRPKPCAYNRLGVVFSISVFSGGATLLHSSGVILCACSGENIWLKHEEIEANFKLGIKGLITKDVFGRCLTLMEHSGPSMKQRHGNCVVAPSKTADMGWSPASLVPVLCRYLPVNRCSFFPHRRSKFRPDLEKWPKTRACN